VIVGDLGEALSAIQRYFDRSTKASSGAWTLRPNSNRLKEQEVANYL